MANLMLIRDLAEKKKIALGDLCEQAEITTQTLREAIKRNSTKTDILERIAHVLNVPIGYFFGEQSPGIIVSGRHNQVHSGQGNQIVLTQEQREIEHLRELLIEKDKVIDEKERLIQFLMEKNGKN